VGGDVDLLGQRRAGLRVGAHLDRGRDEAAIAVAGARREDDDLRARRDHRRDRFRREIRRVHQEQAGAVGTLGGTKEAANRLVPALGDRPERLFLDRREAARLVLLSRIARADVAAGIGHLSLARDDRCEDLLRNLRRGRAARQQMLGAGPLDGLAEDGLSPRGDDVLHHPPGERIADDAGARVGVAAFDGNAQRSEIARLAPQRRRVAHEPGGGAHAAIDERQRVGLHAGQRHADDRLAARRDGVDVRRRDVVGGGDDQDRGDVRMQGEPRQRVEMQPGVRRDLAAAEAGRHGDRAAHESGDPLRRRRR